MLSLNTTSKTLKEYLKRFKKNYDETKKCCKIELPKDFKEGSGSAQVDQTRQMHLQQLFTHDAML